MDDILEFIVDLVGELFELLIDGTFGESKRRVPFIVRLLLCIVLVLIYLGVYGLLFYFAISAVSIPFIIILSVCFLITTFLLIRKIARHLS